MFILPFIFVFEPALILQRPVIELIVPLSTAILGIFLITGGLESYLPKLGGLTTQFRVPFLIAGGLLVTPQWLLSVAGFSLFVLTTALYLLARKMGLTRLGNGVIK